MRKSLCLILVACCLLAGPAQTAAAEPPGTDIVVVGAGISGLCAALEGGRRGAAVIVIDMGSVFGGHAVMSSGMVCMIGTPEQQTNHVTDSPDLAFRDFTRFGGDASAAWARFYAQNSRTGVYDWLHDLGVSEWELYPQVIAGNSVRRQHVAKGRGVGLVGPIYRECLRYPNISFCWSTKVTGLIAEGGDSPVPPQGRGRPVPERDSQRGLASGDGTSPPLSHGGKRVVGVSTVHQRTGRTNEIRAACIVLATGGFEGNLELVRACWPHYFPGLTSDTRILLGSGINSQGSGLELAKNAGGTLSRLDHQLFYSTGLVDPRDPAGGRGTHAFNRAAIWVNAQGKRFVKDGAPDPKTQMPAVLRQSPPNYWAIFDASSRPQFFVSGSDWDDTNVVQQFIFANSKLAAWVKQADTLEGLARNAGLPVAPLTRTVDRWNALVACGADFDFHRFDASTQERPVKIETPPFYAVQFFPLARKSLGGVAVDLSCRVLDRRERPIPGLYAVGELTGVGGINGRAALEGTMLGPSILMGRVAAKDIAAHLRHARSTPVLDTGISAARVEPPTPAGPRVTEPETLRSWQEVLRQLVAQRRPGYLHFEKAHAVVLARNYDCVRCHHQDSSPLALSEDQLDRRALIQACALCHGAVTD